MPAPLPLPPRFLRLFQACADAGGRAIAIGGAVRDHCRGEAPKDLDVEVHGIPPADLEVLLRRLGRVSEVGKSFGVYKLRLGGDEIDVSVPRRDTQGGTGHKSIAVVSDPFLGLREAARRRDLSINAIGWDPLTQTFEDPWDGLGDLDRRLLRAVDPRTFCEDPLRALRVAQFAGRFGFTVDPELHRLCAEMPLGDLPAERIWGEIEKLLMRSPRPSVGWDVAESTGMWARAVPEWAGKGARALDRVATAPVEGKPRRLALMLAAACEGLEIGEVEAVLDRLNVHRVDGYRVREQAVALLTADPAIHRGDDLLDLPTDEGILRAAEGCDVELLAALVGSPRLLERAAALGVSRGPLPALLGGKDLETFGMAPGPQMGATLRALREEQLSGRVTTREGALGWLNAR